MLSMPAATSAASTNINAGTNQYELRSRSQRSINEVRCGMRLPFAW